MDFWGTLCVLSDYTTLPLVCLLENGYNDLRRIGLDREISNSTIASMVEEKLPKTIKAQWCLRMIEGKIDDTDKFPSLITFLLTHKQAVEYGNNELRISQKSSNNGNQLPNRTGATNFGQSSSHGNNKSPRETCWIHADSKGNHPIWQCPDFVKMTVTERKALVMKNKACIKCLLMKYQKRPNISDDQRQVQFLLAVKEGEDEFSEGVLGLRWNVESDTLCIVYNQSISKEAFTKRSVISTVNSIYDPLGLLTPFTIRAKIIMRKMWAYEPKIDWDDSLPSSLVSE